MKDKAKLIKVLRAALKEPYRSAIEQYIRPGIRLKTVGESLIKLGQTKFGGAPDLPSGTAWPIIERDGFPYTFLGQINLAEVKAFDKEKLLPAKGMLYFFVDPEDLLDGKVIFGSRDSKLYIVDAKTGKEISHNKVSGRIISSPCVVDGHVWVGTATGWFYCFGP